MVPLRTEERGSPSLGGCRQAESPRNRSLSRSIPSLESAAMDGTTPGGDIDLSRVRRERLAKVRRAMEQQGVGALVLTNPVHVRYVTGVAVMNLWTSVNLARYAVVGP